ncbi:TolC family protein, partial [Phenylobacterium aquaticum]|uniref:TolC family protein n=1 Tax=Phenylobacterium aquaticum TaxID=1763816 RepID=UPI001F5DE641|nr:TolC family protein [Phenylobacterium aquaticum]
PTERARTPATDLRPTGSPPRTGWSRATTSQTLAQARYDRGVDSYLTLLDAQRTLYGARQTQLAAKLAELNNRVTLYKALGGGVWP